MSTKIAIIGSGIAGMAAACYLQKGGCEVTVYERQSSPGGRARQFRFDGFVFDMGPSWYWMPDVFEAFFQEFGRSTNEFYQLKRLSPSYSVYTHDKHLEIPADPIDLGLLFESMEPGSAHRLRTFLDDAGLKYRLGMHRFAGKPSLGLKEFISFRNLLLLRKLQLHRNMRQHVSRYFQHPVIRMIMEFPVLFLGAMPHRIPAMYSLMNYADTILGTWYPMGGMYEVVKAIYSLARELGVQFKFDCDIQEIQVKEGKATRLVYAGGDAQADAFIAAGDYHHMEGLLEPAYRQYSERYWEGRSMAPSCLLYYIGVSRRLPLRHHSLFFDTSFDAHAASLYELPGWPEAPLFYCCAPSVTDPSVAPPGYENLFLLMPVAAGLKGDSLDLRDAYLKMLLQRLEEHLRTPILQHIVFQKSYGINDFTNDYHAFRGNAYGLANTLRQTAFGKPRMQSRKVPNLFYCGQLTVPGPGLPPALISGKIAAEAAMKHAHEQSFDPRKYTQTNEYARTI